MNIFGGELKDVSEIIHNIWPVLIALIGFAVWLVKLESKVHVNKTAFDEHKKEQNEKQLAIWNKFDTFQVTLMSILQSVSRLEGRLEQKQKENP
jgi:hypothetical protein